MPKFSLFVLGLALIMAPMPALARDLNCGTAEHTAEGLLVRVNFTNVAGETGGSIFLTLKAPDGPLSLTAYMTMRGGKIDEPHLLFGGPATPDLHAPIRSTTTWLSITASDGRRWKSEPAKPRYPHAAEPGEKVWSWGAPLAERRPGAPTRNADLLEAFAEGQALTLRLEGDAGEELSALGIPATKPGGRAERYAEVIDAAKARMIPCGPPTISATPPIPNPPHLYLGPADNGLLTQTPTLEDVVALNPFLKRGRPRGVAILDCFIDGQGLLSSCDRRDRSPGAIEIGRASMIAARQVHVAERFPDGRRTEGLALLLEVRWNKKTLGFAIAPSTEAAVPNP